MSAEENRDTPLPSLDAFDEKLKKAQQEASSTHSQGATTGMAMRLGAEFSAGVLVGVGVGLMLDRWLDTKPWWLMICLCLGAAAGVKTMLATLQRQEKASAESL